MKLPNFQYERQCWDRHKAFHTIEGNGFTQFATGELTIDSTWRDNAHCREYPRFGVTIFKPNAMPEELKALSIFTPDGMQLKRSWLEPSDAMLYDRDTDHLVTLSFGEFVRNREVPSTYAFADVYFPMAGYPPNPRHVTTVNIPPHVWMSEGHKKWAEQARAKAVAMTKMGLIEEIWHHKGMPKFSDVHPRELAQEPDFSQWDAERVWRLAKYGFEFSAQRVHYDRLMMRPA